MANLTPTAGWDAVPQLELTTIARGGPGGSMNLQAQALLNRTEQLSADIAALGGGTALNPTLVTVTASTTLNYGTNIQANSVLSCNHATTPIVITLPSATTDPDMPIGFAVLILWKGVAAVSVAADSGVTINTTETLNLNKRFSMATAIKVAANEWCLDGNLETA